ncbi:MAG: PAS domain S-box protein [Desulfobacteraceae bacterium]|nr:PAS domain S-box protein [Desulfobacteraceae bacterium]
MRSPKTLRKSLVISFLLVSVIPILLIGLISQTYMTRQIAANIQHKNLMLVDMLANELKGQLANAESTIKNITVLLSDHLHSDEQTNSILDGIVQHTDEFSAIYLLEKNGRIENVGLSTQQRPTREDFIGLDLSQLPLFQDTVKHRKPMWSDAFLSPLTGQLTITQGIPYADGILMVDLDITHLSGTIEHLSFKDTTLAMVLDHQGVVIFHSDPTVTKQKRNLKNIISMPAGSLGTAGRFTYQLDLVPYVGCVNMIEETGWTVIISQTEAELSSTSRRVKNLFLICMLVSVAISVAVAIALAKWLSDPLSQLRDHTHAIANGNYEAPLPELSYGEINELAKDFHHMTDAISHRERTLKELATSLGAVSGEAVMGLIVSATTAFLDAEIACVGRMGDDGHLDVTSMIVDRQMVSDISFSLTERPLDKILEEGLYVYASDEGHLFDDHDQLAAYRIKGFAGVRLLGQNGNVIGMLAAMSRRRLNLNAGDKDILTIISSRAASEIERQLVNESLRDSEERYRKLYKKSREAEERYRSLIHSSADAIIMYDLDGKVLYASPSFTHMFGWAFEEIKNQPISFLPDAEKSSTRERIKSVIERGIPCHNYETRRFTKNGDLLDVSISASRFNDHMGKPAGMLVILRDISDKKNLQERLQQAHKLEAVGTLAGGIAHDFNNIISIILGNAELAADDITRDHPARENLSEIQTASLRAKEVVQQLLNFSRKSEHERLPIKPDTIVNESLNLLRASIPKQVSIEREVAGDVYTISADPTQIHQIVINLCTNATHAIDGRGTITVRLSNLDVDADNHGMNVDLAYGRYVRLDVIDSGHGIGPAEKTRIFDPYYTTKEVGKGSGMGLAVVHGIVSGYNGTITVESAAGEGAVFSVFLPALDQPAVSPQVEDTDVAGGAETILLVDDETPLVAIGEKILTRLGYTVLAFTDPEQALRRFESDPDQVNLVVTDMSMPKMNGDALIRKILAIRAETPVILCSGFSETLASTSYAELGAAAYLEKPVKRKVLARIIREVLDGGE